MISHAYRLTKALFVFAREGVFSLIQTQSMPPLARFAIKTIRLVEKKNTSDHLAKALTRLGPTYVKLGQFLATRPDIVGTKMALSLSALQDQVPAFSQEEAIAILEKAFDKPITTLFDTFSTPVAAASVAQVHKATIGDQTFAVKILRPNIEDRFRKDLGDYEFIAKIADLIPSLKRLRIRDVNKTLQRSVMIEMDLRLEAAALAKMRDTYKDDPDFYVPSVHWPLTARNCLTLEWIDGVKLSDQKGLEAHDKVNLARIVLQTFLKNALKDGFFHADMHQGNLFADKKGRLVAIDFGIMGHIGENERLFLAQILYGFITRDYDRVAEWHFRAGYVPKHHSKAEFAQAIRAIGEPIHSLPANEISMANLLGLLFDITEIFEMETRAELVLLQKTMVVAEGVARSLDPNFNMWKVSEPIVEAWLKERIGPVGMLRDIRQDIEKGLSFMREVPQILEKLSAVAPIQKSPSYHLVLWAIVILLTLNLVFK